MPSRAASYKEIISRLRIGIELSGDRFIMHDLGIIVPIHTFGEHIMRIGEEDELPLDAVVTKLLDVGAMYVDDNGRAQFGVSSDALPFVVISHDAVGVWPDEELPNGMQDARGVDLLRIRITNPAKPEERRR